MREFFRHRPVLAFALRTLAWMPPAFWAWYLPAPWLNQPIAWGVQGITNLFWPDLLLDATVQDAQLILLPNMNVPLTDGQMVLASLPFNPLAYTWNLPLLFFDLLLAVRPCRGLAWKLPLAYAALLPAHVWGVFFKFKMTVNVLAHTEIAAQIGMNHFAKTLLVLGNQFGYLMHPVHPGRPRPSEKARAVQGLARCGRY